MKKQAAIIVLISYMATCWPIWGIPPAASGPIPKPSDSLRLQSSDEEQKRVDEVDLLWKLTRRAEAMEKLQTLLLDYPTSPKVLELASFIYLERHELKQAKSIIAQLKQLTGQSPTIDELEAQVLLHEGKWEEAFSIFTKLYQQSEGHKRLALSYADLAGRLHHWSQAATAYEALLKDNAGDMELLWASRRMNEEGATRFTGNFSYYNRPEDESDYVFMEKMMFWIEPQMQFNIEVREEFYNKDASTTAQEIEEWVVAHSFQGKFYHTPVLSSSLRWDMAYSEGQNVPGGGGGFNYQNDTFLSSVGYEANQLVRQPIEAILKRAQEDRLKARNQMTIWQGIQIGNETTISWYEVDGSQNLFNGEDQLGQKIVYDNYFQIPVLRHPYVSLNYHFKRGHWDKEFNGAESVVDFLSDEQVHSPGVYIEDQLCRWFDYQMGGSYNNDVKRDVDFFYGTAKGNLWLKEDIKFSVSLEFLEGDSGVAGKGDSQAVHALIDIYF